MPQGPCIYFFYLSFQLTTIRVILSVIPHSVSLVAVTKAKPHYVPPELNEESFAAAIRAWVQSVDPNLHPWAQRTAHTAATTLEALRRSHGIEASEVLMILEQLKRIEVVDARNREPRNRTDRATPIPSVLFRW